MVARQHRRERRGVIWRDAPNHPDRKEDFFVGYLEKWTREATRVERPKRETIGSANIRGHWQDARDIIFSSRIRNPTRKDSGRAGNSPAGYFIAVSLGQPWTVV